MQRHLPLLLCIMGLLGFLSGQQEAKNSDDDHWSYSSYSITNITVQYGDESEHDDVWSGLYIDVLAPYMGNDTFLFLGYRTPRDKDFMVFGNHKGVLAFPDSKHLSHRISFDNETQISYFVVKCQQEYSNIVAVKVDPEGRNHKYLSAAKIGNGEILIDTSGSQIYYTTHSQGDLLIGNTTFEGSSFNLDIWGNKYFGFTPALNLLASPSVAYVPVRDDLNRYHVVQYNGSVNNSNIVLGKEFIGDSEFVPITFYYENLLAMTITHQNNVYLIILRQESTFHNFKVRDPTHKKYFLSPRSQIYCTHNETYFTAETGNDIVLGHVSYDYDPYGTFRNGYYSAPRQNISAMLLSDHIFLGKTIPSGHKVRILPIDGSSSYLDFYYSGHFTNMIYFQNFEFETEEVKNIKFNRTFMDGTFEPINITSEMNNTRWEEKVFLSRDTGIIDKSCSKYGETYAPVGPHTSIPVYYSKLHDYSMGVL